MSIHLLTELQNNDRRVSRKNKQVDQKNQQQHNQTEHHY
jgi:hypothetical protein